MCTDADEMNWVKVCRFCKEVADLRPVWINAIATEIYGQDLQLPGRDPGTPLADYDTDALRDMTIRGTRLAIRLANVACSPTGEIDFQSRDADANVTHVFFLRGRDSSNWLLTVTSARSISCWEILKSPLDALPAGTWTCEGFLLDVDLDRERLYDGLLAVSTREFKAR